MSNFKIVEVLDHCYPLTVVIYRDPVVRPAEYSGGELSESDLMTLGCQVGAFGLQFRLLNYLVKKKSGGYRIRKKKLRGAQLNRPYLLRAGLLDDNLRSRAKLLREIGK